MYDFAMDEKQRQKFEEWRQSKKKEGMVAIGGRFSFVFTPTGIGTFIVVRCADDNTELDLTDYDTL